jgi:hypothetical protein
MMELLDEDNGWREGGTEIRAFASAPTHTRHEDAMGRN